ncbi:hypothetical protein GXP67_04300 [Rhodocytophaga rosea]|uniref:Lipoprotein n=1 Tax=Rhodocytophaga rosea TaxID=2704465 RepID=A0A6C0GD96_9BACT|nr:hypothetical protein [Rhodocytophaga rosea]QHT65945.1 hypothetical protein GXP67_04300 [Rhodocytophaga rosea]
MKNSQTQVWRTRIYYGWMVVFMHLIILLMAACQMEERKKSAPLQTTDTLQNSPQREVTSGTREAFPGGDTIQQDCQFIQGQAESLLEEYHQSRTTAARKRQVIAELKKLELVWKRKECQQVFGYMIPHIPTPSDTGKQVVQ